jgi:predicted ABC-type ATPase/2'-5' RNA ligase
VTITAQLPDLFPDAAGPFPSVAAQVLGLAADAEVSPQAMHAPGLPVPDDKTAVAMFTAHRLDDTARELAHATERMQAAREASGDLRRYHSAHIARHLQNALDATHYLAQNLKEHYAPEARELETVRQTIGLASGYDLNPRSGMISLDLPPGTIAPVPGGVDSHHITVVYLGPDVDDEAFAQACDRAREAAAAMPGPIAGTVGGIGTFKPSGSSDGKVPAWAGVVLPGAERVRGALEDLSASEHKDWKPHVTIAYVEPGEALPAPVPATPVTFTHLSVHRGRDEVARFPLGGSATGLAGTAEYAIGLAKAVSPAAKAATTSHLLETSLHEETHGRRHADAMLKATPDDEWGFNADHCEKHLKGAVEHVGKLAQHMRDNYPDVARWLAELGEITAGTGNGDGNQHAKYSKHGPSLAGITAQALDLGTISAQLDLAEVDVRPFERVVQTRLGPRTEVVRGHTEQRDWIPEPKWKAGQQEWKAKGEAAWKAKALPWDAEGDVMQYHGSLGIDRADMPQVSGLLADGRYAPSSEMMPKFLDHLKARGIKVDHERVPARSLKPTQTTGDMRAVRGIAGSLASGDLQDTKPVLVSSDNRVIDGHHQWAAHVLGDAEGTRTGSAPGEPVIRADLPAGRLLEEARRFAEDQGIANRKTGVAANPKYARPSIAEQAAPADTLEKYTRPDGTFTPERAALHKKIIDDILAGHQPQEHPVATFFGGGPASGKSTALTSTHPDSALIDADAIKARLPEYQQMLDAKDPRAASYVHGESSHVAKQAVKEAQKRHLNFTWDGTGDSDIAKLAGKVNDARNAGYATEGKYVTVGTDEAVRRAEARAKATGRHVPEEFIRQTHASVSDTYGKAAKMGLFDHTELWDTSGHAPKLVAHKEPGGKFTVHDPAAWRAFLDKAKEGQP